MILTWIVLYEKGQIQKVTYYIVVSSLSHVQLSPTHWTAACQAPLSIGFPRQEYWTGLPFPPLWALPDPGVEPKPPTLAGAFFTNEPPGNC